MNWFTENVGVRGILAILTIVTFCYMVATGIEVTGEFYAVIGVVLGFYFSTQTLLVRSNILNGGNKSNGER